MLLPLTCTILRQCQYCLTDKLAYDYFIVVPQNTYVNASTVLLIDLQSESSITVDTAFTTVNTC